MGLRMDTTSSPSSCSQSAPPPGWLPQLAAQLKAGRGTSLCRLAAGGAPCTVTSQLAAGAARPKAGSRMLAALGSVQAALGDGSSPPCLEASAPPEALSCLYGSTDCTGCREAAAVACSSPG